MANVTVTKGYNSPTGWTTGETVTAEKLNQAQTPAVSVTLADDEVTAAKLDGIADIDTKTADYTLVLADAGRVIEFNSASNLTLTVPTNASVAFATGATVVVTRRGAGEVTVAGASGVTLRSDASKSKIRSQYTAATLIKIGSDEWMLTGNIKA